MSYTLPAARPWPSISAPETVRIGAAIGLVAGVAYGAWDLHHHVPRALGIDLVLISLLGALPGVLLGAGAGVMLAGASRLFGRRLSRARCAGVLAGTMIVALAASAAILILNWSEMQRAGLVLGSVPAAFLVFALFGRFAQHLGAHWRPEVLALALVLGMLLAEGGAQVSGALGIAWATRSLLLLAALGALGLGVFAFPSAPRRTLLLLVPALAATVAALLWSSAARLDRALAPSELGRPPSPNVVVVVLDTTRRDRLGCYGHPGGLTPALDSLARVGTVFENAFSPSNWTAPAHASLFTGLPPVSHGLSAEYRMRLDDSAVTLAEHLKKRGYETVALCSNPWIARGNMLQGFDHAALLLGKYYELSMLPLCMDLGLPERWIDKGGDEARRALEAWLAVRTDSDRPFLLFVNLLEPHSPYFPPRAERKASSPEGVTFDEANQVAHALAVCELHQARQSDAHTARVIGARYEAGIRYQDSCLQGLLDALGRRVNLDRTLLIVTSDHGENIDDDGRWGHQFALNDTLTHVPLVIRYPELFAPNTRNAGTCSLMDIVPTVLAVVDPSAAPVVPDGRSLVPGQFEPRTAVFSQMYPHFSDFESVMSAGGDLGVFSTHWRAIRTESWKFVWASDGDHRLFDLEADPKETTNVLGERSQVAQELEQRLVLWWDAQAAFEPSEAAEPGAPEASMELLHDLGYGGR